ncbi:MAG: zinc ABC transporter substrate-binding protein [Salaquimonas sp.]|jgi:zinc transport system substrate-binding protein|nr:zinc ABC transporter substrate-binding protein [Salaquimonas sp.]
MPSIRLVAAAGAILVGLTLNGQAAPKVVASIKPIHSLVASVMQGVGTPDLIVEGASSPHTYALRPSQASEIEQADVVFWVGHELEPFLEKPLESLGGNAEVVELADVHGLTLLSPREGGAFEPHRHDANEHDNAHGETDPHIWLDPHNAAAMLPVIEETLARTDPANAATYRTNAEKTATRLNDLERKIDAVVTPVKDKPFIVFHDAYHYFENRFGLAAAGSITVSPEVAPGAERITQIRAKLADTHAACVFAEPQFEPKIISVVIEGSSARSGVLDPLGATLEPGPDLYFKVLDNLAGSFRDCLMPAS